MSCFRADCDHPEALPLKSVYLLQLSLRFSTVKFQFTVCATKAPLCREISHGAPFCSLFPPSRIMPTKILPSNKSSRRRLGSLLNSRQEASPASTEVGPSTSSTPSISLRGDAGSAKVTCSLSGYGPIMDTHGSVVPSQSSLVESRINKRRDRSPSETSDGRADTSRGNPSSDRGNPSADRGNPSTIRGNPSKNNRGNPSDQESPVDFLDSTLTASADHSMSLKDITQLRSRHLQSSSITTRRERWFTNALLTSCRNFMTTTNT